MGRWAGGPDGGHEDVEVLAAGVIDGQAIRKELEADEAAADGLGDAEGGVSGGG